MLAASYAALADRTDVEVVRVNSARHAKVDRLFARTLGSTGRSYLPAHSLSTTLRWGRETTARLGDLDVDAVLAIAASSLTAFADIRVPVVSVSDSTFVRVSQTYPSYATLPTWAVRQAIWLERRAWLRSTECIVTSQWAAKSLVGDYGIDPKKCHVLPFGPGIQPTHPIQDRGAHQPLRLLLVARDWERKGGNRVLQVLPLLRRMNLDVRLTVVGPKPTNVTASEQVTWIDSLGRSDMASIYAESDVLIDLAHANCAAVTLVDAANWGLPVVATGVGATEELVHNGRTGIVVPNDEHVPENAARAIAQLAQPTVYWEMRAETREGSSTWQRWADGVEEILAEIPVTSH